MTSLTKINVQMPSPANANRFALWQLGFRPFYLFASIFSALSIAVWAMQFAGWFPNAYLAGPAWHAHEMLFGYALAVIVGFLFTAGRAWSGQKTPSGKLLMLIVAVWFSARVLVLTPYGWMAAAANALFPLLAAAALAVPFFKARVKRNYFFVALLVMMACASLSIHGVKLGVIDLPPLLGVQLALDVVLFIMVVMGGRVIPAFTASGVTGVKPHSSAVLNKLALGSVLAILMADALQFGGTPMAMLLVLSALAHLVRLGLWRSFETVGVALVWVLHAAYAWIVIHLMMRSLFEFGLISSSIATHALTTGAIGTLTLGMMIRTARGHTGRALQADYVDIACFVLVLISASVRVFVPWLLPALTMQSVLFSALFWSAAFALFAFRYWPVLSRARLDGKAG